MADAPEPLVLYECRDRVATITFNRPSRLNAFNDDMAREALAAMENGAFDVVLMDVQMPEMDGLEATAAIRAGERHSGKHQMVIALTAHAMKGDQERCVAAGMDGYLSKPIQSKELRRLLERTDGHEQERTGPGADSLRYNGGARRAANH